MNLTALIHGSCWTGGSGSFVVKLRASWCKDLIFFYFFVKSKESTEGNGDGGEGKFGF